MAPNPAVLLRELASSVGAVGAPNGGWVALAIVSLLVARASLPQILFGQQGWLRSLPVSGGQHRRTLLVALIASLGPVLAVELAALMAVPTVYRGTLSGSKIVALPLVALSVVMVVLPVRGVGDRPMIGWVARLLAVLSLGSLLGGGWLGVGAGLGFLLAADRLAGDVAVRRDRGPRPESGLDSTILLTWRALGARIAGPLVPGAVVLLFARLFRINNGLTLLEAGPAIRAVGIACSALAIGSLANAVLSRRPPWPWVRSLPWSASRRARLDAVAIGLPVLLGLVVPLAVADWRSALLVGATLPPLALLGAGAIRRGRGRTSGAAGELLFAAAIGAPLVGFLPGSLILGLALVPLLDRAAARAERNLRVSGWDELRHRAEGDSLSWSAR
jgi:hypothetical protein